MRRLLIGGLRQALILLAVVAATLLGVRAYDAHNAPPLEPWHLHVPDELSARELDRTDWDGYLRAEASLFERLHAELAERRVTGEGTAINRYAVDGPIDPARFDRDWNRSYALAPEGKAVGAVVLLHGMTDSPYSLRHVAERYRAHGYAVVAIRLPGHGTVPAGLTVATWQDWLAATRLAVREARRRAGADGALHLVGYSTGGALALKFVLDAVSETSDAGVDRIVLISPMIGLTSYARFAGFAALPALLPRFAKAAWLSLLPEFNPFKYNSFPVNAAHQAHLLSVALQERIVRHAREGRLERFPPVLTFQSVMDSTVTTHAVLSALYRYLPANDSELVLFDLNRAAALNPLLRADAETKLNRILPAAPRTYRVAIVTNAAPDTTRVVAQVVDAGETSERVEPLDLVYPSDVYSLSHIALPFPPDDALYGRTPDAAENYGVHLGTITPRGERGVLVVGLDTLLRLTYNPFFPYLVARIDAGLVGRGREAGR